MNTNTYTKFYWTKYRKIQLRYWKIMIAVFLLAVAVLGLSQTYTERFIANITHAVVSIPQVNAAPLPIEQEAVQETVEEQIRRIAKEQGFQWPEYLVRLAHCESRFDPNATNDNGYYGLDRGLFQINNFFHSEVTDEQAFDLEWSTKWTMERINKGYQHEWMCDPIIRKK